MSLPTPEILAAVHARDLLSAAFEEKCAECERLKVQKAKLANEAQGLSFSNINLRRQLDEQGEFIAAHFGSGDWKKLEAA